MTAYGLSVLVYFSEDPFDAFKEFAVVISEAGIEDVNCVSAGASLRKMKESLEAQNCLRKTVFIPAVREVFALFLVYGMRWRKKGKTMNIKGFDTFGCLWIVFENSAVKAFGAD